MRSVLFTPAPRIDRVEKAWRTGAADVVVADLEDATPLAEKANARSALADLLLGLPTHEAATIRAVRINPWPSALGEDDLDAILPGHPDLIVVPKAADAESVAALGARLDDAGSDARILLLLETAEGVLAARELAAASDRVAGLAFGAEDLAADAGMRRSPSNQEVSVPRSMVALAAAANRIAAIDMITADFQDAERFSREASEARDLGYAGKMCLHPAQVSLAHKAFMPTPEEIAWAKQVVRAAENAGAGAGGVTVVDGSMIDVPLIQQARRILTDAASDL